MKFSVKLCLSRDLNCHKEALKIILHFYAFTYTYFTLEEYSDLKSKS